MLNVTINPDTGDLMLMDEGDNAVGTLNLTVDESVLMENETRVQLTADVDWWAPPQE